MQFRASMITLTDNDRAAFDLLFSLSIIQWTIVSVKCQKCEKSSSVSQSQKWCPQTTKHRQQTNKQDNKNTAFYSKSIGQLNNENMDSKSMHLSLVHLWCTYAYMISSFSLLINARPWHSSNRKENLCKSALSFSFSWFSLLPMPKWTIYFWNDLMVSVHSCCW